MSRNPCVSVAGQRFPNVEQLHERIVPQSFVAVKISKYRIYGSSHHNVGVQTLLGCLTQNVSDVVVQLLEKKAFTLLLKSCLT
ncbi:unnamed protein product [Litomosoides sigmodontis]|uniref:Uncharacterized protein n=1 Tax=Litomosoides sigmodontis TaxID=42156 RepID=A0A3P6SXU1_LITSI|nr:unnamed protein product [Litomosoides sigmodontis]